MRPDASNITSAYLESNQDWTARRCVGQSGLRGRGRPRPHGVEFTCGRGRPRNGVKVSRGYVVPRGDPWDGWNQGGRRKAEGGRVAGGCGWMPCDGTPSSPDRARGIGMCKPRPSAPPGISSAFRLPPSATTLGLTERYPRISEQRLTFTPLGRAPEQLRPGYYPPRFGAGSSNPVH
jgi:hypothetical protein